MNDLTNLSFPLELDASDAHGSIGMLSDQMRHAWVSVAKIDVPDSYKDVDNIVVFAMGGSALGTDVMQHLYAKTLKVPVTIVNDYHVPGFVNERTLVLLSSYSGSTEEVVMAAEEALKRTKKVLVIATGKNLKEIAEQEGLPIYVIDPKFNPSEQPRIAIGYSIIGQLAFFSRLGLIDLTGEEVEAAAKLLDDLRLSYCGEADTNNPAKDLARKIADEGRIPVLVTSEHMRGVAHVFRNQINENGKHMAAMLEVPEMNHHAMEGLAFPEATKQLLFVLFPSKRYNERTQKRYEVLREILDKQGLDHAEVAPHGDTPLQETFAGLLFGGYVGFFVAMLNGIDPSPIPWVDLFKERLG